MYDFNFDIKGENLYQNKELQACFLRFLSAEHNDENFRFMMALYKIGKDFGNLKEENMVGDPKFREAINAVFEEFVSKDAPSLVNLSGNQFKRLSDAHQNGKLTLSHFLSDFTEGQELIQAPIANIHQMVRNDPLRRFLASPDYKKYVERDTEYVESCISKILTAANVQNLAARYETQIQSIENILRNKTNGNEKRNALKSLMVEWYHNEINKPADKQDPEYITFLKDGLKTLGESDKSIKELVENHIEKIRAEEAAKAAKLAKDVSAFREQAKSLLHRLKELSLEKVGDVQVKKEALLKLINEQAEKAFSSPDEIEEARKKIQKDLIAMHTGLGPIGTQSMSGKVESTGSPDRVKCRSVLRQMVIEIRQSSTTTLSPSSHSRGPSLMDLASAPSAPKTQAEAPPQKQQGGPASTTEPLSRSHKEKPK